MWGTNWLTADSDGGAEQNAGVSPTVTYATGVQLPSSAYNDYSAIAGLNADALRDSLQTVIESYRSLEALEREDPTFSHIPPEMRRNLEERQQILERRKQEIIQKLASPPDWKQYMLPTLVAAYVLRDDPEALGLVLATSAMGYEAWRRSERDRYMQALLKVQNEEDRLHRTIRQWQEFSTNRNLRLLTQARILANTMTTQVQRSLNIQLREQHRAWMRSIGERRLQETQQARADRIRREATARYWATIREMERWINNYPANRAEIYEMFRPILDDYAATAGLSGIHNNAALRSATSVGQMTSYLRLLRLAELARGVQSDDDMALGAAINALSSPTQMLGLVRDHRAVARTVRDAQVLTGFIDETISQVSLLYPEMGDTARAQLQTVADALGLQDTVDANNFERVREQVINALNEARQRIQSGALRRTNDFSAEFAKAAISAMGGSPNKIDPKANIADQIKAWVTQQLTAQLGGLTGAIAAPMGSTDVQPTMPQTPQPPTDSAASASPISAVPAEELQRYANAFNGRFYSLGQQANIEHVYSSANDFVPANPAGLFGSESDERAVQQLAELMQSQNPDNSVAAKRMLLVYRHRNSIPAPLMHTEETPMREAGHTGYHAWTPTGQQPIVALVIPVQNAFSNNTEYRRQIHRWTWLQVKKQNGRTVYTPNPNTHYDFVVLKGQDSSGNPTYHPMLVVSARLSDGSTTARVPIALIPVTHLVGIERNRLDVSSGVREIPTAGLSEDGARWLAGLSAWAQAVSKASLDKNEAALRQLGEEFTKKYRAGFQQNRVVTIFTNPT